MAITGLDYFNARYYSPAQGRFVSPDPGNAGADLGNPQTWNGYAYVGNNPLSVTDPTGQGFMDWLAGISFMAINDAFFGRPGAFMGDFSGGWFGSLPTVGSITGCGGPLGNCGGIGGAWTEQSPIGQAVQGPGRFVFDVNPFGIRETNQSFKGCMEQHASDYSLAGLIDNGSASAGYVNVHLSDNFLGSTFLGNNVTGTAFFFAGTTKQSADNALTTGVNYSLLGNSLIRSSGIAGAVGSNLTAGRRTASIMSLNLKGTTGTAPQVLARSSAMRSTLSRIGKIGNASLLIDMGLALGEAINCSMTP